MYKTEEREREREREREGGGDLKSMFVSGKSKKVYCIFNAQTVEKRIKHIKHAYLNLQ